MMDCIKSVLNEKLVQIEGGMAWILLRRFKYLLSVQFPFNQNLSFFISFIRTLFLVVLAFRDSVWFSLFGCNFLQIALLALFVVRSDALAEKFLPTANTLVYVLLNSKLCENVTYGKTPAIRWAWTGSSSFFSWRYGSQKTAWVREFGLVQQGFLSFKFYVNC